MIQLEKSREDQLRVEALEQARRYLADQSPLCTPEQMVQTAAQFFNFLIGKETNTSEH